MNLIALVSKHSGCEIGDSDVDYSQEQFFELVSRIFQDINQLVMWNEENTVENCDDQVLDFHKGSGLNFINTFFNIFF